VPFVFNDYLKRKAWMAGSSPAMTISGFTVLGFEAAMPEAQINRSLFASRRASRFFFRKRSACFA
jgi:hypothetical protein